jgi:hypothetical protein
LLAVMGIVLVGFGLVAEVPIANWPVILIGALLLILHEFHSRIHGRIGLSKFHASVVSDGSQGMGGAAPADLNSHREARQRAGQREAAEPDWDLPTRQRGRYR